MNPDSPGAAEDRGLFFLERAGVAPPDQGDPGPLVALAPGADHPRAPRWPWRRFAELARGLRREHPSLRLFLLTAAEEMWPSVRIHEETGHFHPLIGPDLQPDDVAAVLRHVTLWVGHPSKLADAATQAGAASVLLTGRPWFGSGPEARSPSVTILSGLILGLPGFDHRRLSGLDVPTVLTACGARLAP